jgi:hypothetical protein
MMSLVPQYLRTCAVSVAIALVLCSCTHGDGTSQAPTSTWGARGLVRPLRPGELCAAQHPYPCVVLPNVLGMTASAATARLELEFGVSVLDCWSPTAGRYGIVVGEFPKGNRRVEEHTDVDLSVTAPRRLPIPRSLPGVTNALQGPRERAACPGAVLTLPARS